MTLDELILEYGTNKDLLDKTKKICDTDNTAIKELMKKSSIDKYTSGPYTVSYGITQKEVVDEDSMLDYLKKHIDPSSDVIKTKEYIDADALENAIYKKELPDDVIAGLSQFSTIKETEVLRLKKAKEK